MADSRDGWQGTPKDYGWRSITTVEDPPPPPVRPENAASLKKKEFLSSVIKANPAEILEWHAGRTDHEQARFVQVLDDLYSHWSGGGKKKRRSRSAKPQRSSAPRLASISESGREFLEGRERSSAGSLPGSRHGGSRHGSVGGSRHGSVGGSRHGDDVQSVSSLRSSASAPNLRPIDVRNAVRTAEARLGVPDGNTLQRWIETRSATPASVSTDWTNASKMTRTSQGTVMSAPCTKYTFDFRRHDRAFAVNRRKWKVPDAHEPESSLCTDGLPESKRLVTSFQRDYGVVEKGATMRKETALQGFKPESHGFIEQYLEAASPAMKEDFSQVGRAMHTFNHVKHYSTSTARSFDINKNRTLWNPGPAKPVVTNPYRSSVPLGNLNNSEGEYVPPPPQPIPDVFFPPA